MGYSLPQETVMLFGSLMYVPSYWHFNFLLPYYSNFFMRKLLNPPLDTSLNESFNKAFAWSPKPISAFCVWRWHNEFKIDYLKFRVKGFSWVCIFLCRSFIVSQFKLENPRINPNQEFWIKKSQSDKFIRHWKCCKTCGNSLEGAQIYTGRKANSQLLSKQCRFSCYCWGIGSILLRISCIQICSPSIKKEKLRSEQAQAASICRRSGSFLMGQDWLTSVWLA